MYEEGRIVGVLTAEPTPHKKKRKRGGNSKQLGKGRKLDLKRLRSDDSESEDEESELQRRHPFKLPSTYKYTDSRDGEVLQVWNDSIYLFIYLSIYLLMVVCIRVYLYICVYICFGVRSLCVLHCIALLLDMG